VRVIAVMLVVMMIITCGCNGGQDKAIDDQETSADELKSTAVELSYDVKPYVPQGFQVTTKKDAEDGSVFLVACEQSIKFELSPHILIIATHNFLKRSAVFEAKDVKFGTGKSWGVPMTRGDAETLGYSVSIDLGTGDIPGYFVKVFVSPEYDEVLSSLGSGYVARDFTDIDGNGATDLLMIDTRWADVPLDIVAGQPFTQAVCEYVEGEFVDKTFNHNTQMNPGIERFSTGLSSAQDDANILYYAINLMLTMYQVGDKKEAVEGFSTIISRLTDDASIEFAIGVIDYLNSYDFMEDGLAPPWFAPTNNPAWTALEFETLKVNN